MGFIEHRDQLYLCFWDDILNMSLFSFILTLFTTKISIMATLLLLIQMLPMMLRYMKRL